MTTTEADGAIYEEETMGTRERERAKLEADEAELHELARYCRRYASGRERPDDQEVSYFLEDLASVLERYGDEAAASLEGEEVAYAVWQDVPGAWVDIFECRENAEVCRDEFAHREVVPVLVRRREGEGNG